MLHFAPHKRAYKAHREEKRVGGIGEDDLLSIWIFNQNLELLSQTLYDL